MVGALFWNTEPYRRWFLGAYVFRGPEPYKKMDVAMGTFFEALSPTESDSMANTFFETLNLTKDGCHDIHVFRGLETYKRWFHGGHVFQLKKVPPRFSGAARRTVFRLRRPGVQLYLGSAARHDDITPRVASSLGAAALPRGIPAATLHRVASHLGATSPFHGRSFPRGTPLDAASFSARQFLFGIALWRSAATLPWVRYLFTPRGKIRARQRLVAATRPWTRWILWRVEILGPAKTKF